MKIIHPTLTEGDIGHVAFQEMTSRTPGGEAFTITVDGIPSAELATLELPDNGTFALYPWADGELGPDGCWTLNATDPSGHHSSSHVMFVAAQRGPNRHLTGELAAWATLTMIWSEQPDSDHPQG